MLIQSLSADTGNDSTVSDSANKITLSDFKNYLTNKDAVPSARLVVMLSPPNCRFCNEFRNAANETANLSWEYLELTASDLEKEGTLLIEHCPDWTRPIASNKLSTPMAYCATSFIDGHQNKYLVSAGGDAEIRNRLSLVTTGVPVMPLSDGKLQLCSQKLNFVLRDPEHKYAQTPAFVKIANLNWGKHCFHVTNDPLVENEAVFSAHFINEDPLPFRMSEEISFDNIDFGVLEKFVNEQSPKIGVYNRESEPYYRQQFEQYDFIFLAVGMEDQFHAFHDYLYPIVKNLDNILIAFYPQTEQSALRGASFWQNKSLPAIIFLRRSLDDQDNVEVDTYTTEFKLNDDEATLRQWFNNALDDNLPEDLRSQDISVARDNPDGLSHIVGSQFPKFFDGTFERSFCIRFHAQWCGHCQGMKQNWINAAETLMKRYGNKFYIADIDGAENSVSKQIIKVTGFPTVLCYSQETQIKKQMPAASIKKHDELVSWVEEHIIPEAAKEHTEETAKADAVL